MVLLQHRETRLAVSDLRGVPGNAVCRAEEDREEGVSSLDPSPCLLQPAEPEWAGMECWKRPDRPQVDSAVFQVFLQSIATSDEPVKLTSHPPFPFSRLLFLFPVPLRLRTGQRHRPPTVSVRSSLPR